VKMRGWGSGLMQMRQSFPCGRTLARGCFHLARGFFAFWLRAGGNANGFFLGLRICQIQGPRSRPEEGCPFVRNCTRKATGMDIVIRLMQDEGLHLPASTTLPRGRRASLLPQASARNGFAGFAFSPGALRPTQAPRQRVPPSARSWSLRRAGPRTAPPATAASAPRCRR